MNDLITISLDDRPDIFTYQGKYFRKIAEDYDSANFNVIIDETYSVYGDPNFQIPVPLTVGGVSKLDNATANDLTSIYIQAPEYDVPTKIAIVDPFIDATLIDIVSHKDANDNITLTFAGTLFDIPGEVYSIRLKGVLYNVTFYGVDYQTDIVGSAAFHIAPDTESLLKTEDFSLITSISDDSYIDIIGSIIS
jgi:hypothetical protein